MKQDIKKLIDEYFKSNEDTITPMDVEQVLNKCLEDHSTGHKELVYYGIIAGYEMARNERS